MRDPAIPYYLRNPNCVNSDQFHYGCFPADSPLSHAGARRRQLMLGRIARRYDAANIILSGGMDRLVAATTRRGGAATLSRFGPDLATGSGDVAFALSRALDRQSVIVGMDFCQPMLDRAEVKKLAARPGQFSNVTFRPGDGLALPLPDACQDAVTISFGLRNLEDRPRGLREMRRVLRPGGRLFVLEFSQPQAWFRPIYYFYLRRILPRIAGGDRRPRRLRLPEQHHRGAPESGGHSGEITAADFLPGLGPRPDALGIVALHEAVN